MPRPDDSAQPEASDPGDFAGGSDADATDVGGNAVPPWLLRHRVTVPEPPINYCDRAELTRRGTPTRQRMTLLMAPGGFGKTTLLAECCRDAMAAGVTTAWLSLAEDDDPTALDTYLAFAFQLAGVDILAEPTSVGAGVGMRFPRTGLLVRALEARDQPCVLALDELERVKNPESVALLTFLLQSAPPNLHVAMACRELPVALDALVAVLGAGAEILTAEDLRFSIGDVARFFDLELSRRELADVMSDSSGWPIALRICRNEAGRRPPKDARVVRDVIENWIAGRFWDGFTEADQQLILDIGLFDWIDAALVEDVLESPGALEHIARLAGLEGLLETKNRGSFAIYTLHPLLREHCSVRRRREDPDHYQEVHRRIGSALAARGETVAAMRHAVEGGDPGLAGRMLIDAGCLQWWMREGADRLMAASRFLTDEVVAQSPRLAMVRSVVLMLTGRQAEARRTLSAVSAGAALGRDLGFDADWRIACGLQVVTGCEPIGSAQTISVMENGRHIADQPNMPPVLRATADCGLCLYHNLRGEFDAALERGSRARQRMGRRSTYMTMVIDFEFGQVAMARGQVQDALKWYRSGQRAAKARFLRDPSLAAYGDVLMRELNLERNRFGDCDDQDIGIWKEVYRSGAQFASYAASSEVSAEVALKSGGEQRALSALEEMWDHAVSMELTALERHLAALYVSVLADVDRVAEAERIWRTADLPEVDAECVDLGHQTWREMEAITCARLRLLTAGGAYDTGRELARTLVEVAAGRGLKRTELRALALSIALEHRAGRPEAAMEHVEAYVLLYAMSDYARPLVRVDGAGLEALGRLLDANPDGPLADAAGRLWSALERGSEKLVPPRLTGKQKEVLARLRTQPDKEIAAALGLTTHGVRYHIRNIFRKLHARDRSEAVHRAHTLGLLPLETRR